MYLLSPEPQQARNYCKAVYRLDALRATVYGMATSSTPRGSCRNSKTSGQVQHLQRMSDCWL